MSGELDPEASVERAGDYCRDALRLRALEAALSWYVKTGCGSPISALGDFCADDYGCQYKSFAALADAIIAAKKLGVVDLSEVSIRARQPARSRSGLEVKNERAAGYCCGLYGHIDGDCPAAARKAARRLSPLRRPCL